MTLGGGGNREFQLYSNSKNNSYVRNGTLFIKPTPTDEYFGEERVRHGALDLWNDIKSCTAPQFSGQDQYR